jgi:hypothetical protein
MENKKPNDNIRQHIKKSGFYSYEVSDKLGVHENTLCRLLRKELSESDKKRIFKALDDLQAESEKELSQIK